MTVRKRRRGSGITRRIDVDIDMTKGDASENIEAAKRFLATLSPVPWRATWRGSKSRQS
jgi:hypothetical protein